MADLFHNLILGFGVAVSPINLLLCLIGALVGTLVGVLPGIGTIATSPCCCRSPSACRRSAR